MRLVFLGPPGAGKGTQAVRYATEHELPHVSTGDMLRAAVAAGSPAGMKAKPIMEAGGLVSDDIVLACVEERLDKDAKAGFILDGYPRNPSQAQDLERVLAKRGMSMDAVVNFDLPIEVIVPRMAGRRSCAKCGSVYHVTGNPPKKAGVCDKDGEALVQRADDKEEVVRERMKTYAAKTEPLISHYRSKGILLNVDANGDVETIYGRLKKTLGGLKTAAR